MDVAVIGAGYVGLVQAGGLTHLGHRVRLAEADSVKLSMLSSGKVPIYEPGLADLIERAIDNDLISFWSDNGEAVTGAGIVFLTLPTPTGDDDCADISVIEVVVSQIAPYLESDTVLVIKSTVPVGTAAAIRELLDTLGCAAGVVSNPEFLAEGNAVEDFLRAERVVIGAFESDHAARVAELYRGLPSQILITDPASAELIKYGANAYLAARLTFANSLAAISDRVGADVLDVVKGIGLDRRIGPHFMRPGPGYGGSCFPKDTRAMVSMAEAAGFDFRLLRTVIETNDWHREGIVARCVELLDGDVSGKKVAIWGIAFKSGTDDTRESPALGIARDLATSGADVVSCDPEAVTDAVPMVESPLAAAVDADLLVVATEWPEFLRVDLGQVAKAMSGDIVYDVRNLLDPVKARAAGLRYVGLGRPRV